MYINTILAIFTSNKVHFKFEIHLETKKKLSTNITMKNFSENRMKIAIVKLWLRFSEVFMFELKVRFNC